MGQLEVAADPPLYCRDRRPALLSGGSARQEPHPDEPPTRTLTGRSSPWPKPGRNAAERHAAGTKGTSFLVTG